MTTDLLAPSPAWTGSAGGMLVDAQPTTTQAPAINLPEGVEVTIKEGVHAGRAAKISGVLGNGARTRYVVVMQGGENTTVDADEVPAADVTPAQPAKKDRVVILSGDLHLYTGVLVGVDGSDGIVKMDTTEDIKIVELSSCAKLAAP